MVTNMNKSGDVNNNNNNNDNSFENFINLENTYEVFRNDIELLTQLKFACQGNLEDLIAAFKSFAEHCQKKGLAIGTQLISECSKIIDQDVDEINQRINFIAPYLFKVNQKIARVSIIGNQFYKSQVSYIEFWMYRLQDEAKTMQWVIKKVFEDIDLIVTCSDNLEITKLNTARIFNNYKQCQELKNAADRTRNSIAGLNVLQDKDISQEGVWLLQNQLAFASQMFELSAYILTKYDYLITQEASKLVSACIAKLKTLVNQNNNDKFASLAVLRQLSNELKKFVDNLKLIDFIKAPTTELGMISDIIKGILDFEIKKNQTIKVESEEVNKLITVVKNNAFSLVNKELLLEILVNHEKFPSQLNKKSAKRKLFGLGNTPKRSMVNFIQVDRYNAKIKNTSEDETIQEIEKIGNSVKDIVNSFHYILQTLENNVSQIAAVIKVNCEEFITICKNYVNQLDTFNQSCYEPEIAKIINKQKNLCEQLVDLFEMMYDSVTTDDDGNPTISADNLGEIALTEYSDNSIKELCDKFNNMLKTLEENCNYQSCGIVNSR